MTTPKELYLLRPSMSGGGADRVTLTLLQELPRESYRLTLVLMRSEGEFAEDVPDDVRIVTLGAADSRTAWWPLARLLRREPPQILFSTSGGTNLIAVLASRLARCQARVVLSERGLLRRSLSTKRRISARLKRLAYPRADLVTAVSQGVRDQLVRELGLTPRSVAVVYNPVVNKSLQRSASETVDHPWFSERTPVVLAAGRLVAEKDHPSLITAFAQVRAEREARLVVLGEGPLRARLEGLARSLGVAEDVSLPGFDKNPFKYMARCTVFVSSSIYEGLPGALIQAMACGAAVVSTDCPGGPAEVVTSGDDGILVPMADSDALGATILELLDDRDGRHRLGRRAVESAQRFSVDAVLGNYLAALAGGGGTEARP